MLYYSMCQYANHIIYQHSKTNFEKFCLRFYITKKGSPFFFFIVSPNCPKRLKNRLFLPESPLFEAKIYPNLSLSGQKLSIMILENSSDYRHFDNDKLSIANTSNMQCSNILRCEGPRCEGPRSEAPSC
jgi:hypothetical protein